MLGHQESPRQRGSGTTWSLPDCVSLPCGGGGQERPCAPQTGPRRTWGLENREGSWEEQLHNGW